MANRQLFALIFITLLVLNSLALVTAEETPIKHITRIEEAAANDETLLDVIWSKIKEQSDRLETYLEIETGKVIGTRDQEGNFIYTTKAFRWDFGSYVVFALIVFAWTVTFEILTTNMFTAEERGRKIYITLGILAMALFLFFIPLIRIAIPILTLEITQLSWFIRSFILASIIYFGGPIIRRYERYQKRKEAYRRQMQKISAEELAKIQLHS